MVDRDVFECGWFLLLELVIDILVLSIRELRFDFKWEVLKDVIMV